MPVTYTDFYVAADIVNWDDSLHQISGVTARIGNIGAGTTRGYLFTHDRGNPSSSTSGDMDIVRIDGEQPTSLKTFGSDSIHFEPGSSYRLVFIGVGSHLIGQVFKLPDLVVPVLEITAEDSAYTSGYSGLIVADNSEPTYDGACDVTFDNYLATSGAPYLYDNFNDGNDTLPLPPWYQYNPLTIGSYSFPGGTTYRLQSPASPNPGSMGQARVGSVRPANLSSFYVCADIVNWDDSVRQIAGVMARINSVGAGTTTGYLFTHDRGDPTSSTQGDMDIARVDNEYGISLPTTGNDSIHFQPGKQYRLVFTGDGDQLRGRVYELPDTSTPVVDITTTDPYYTSGACGLIAANNAEFTYDGPADATFDNFLMLAAEPSLSVSVNGTSVVVTWPGIPYTLQTTSSLSSPNWTTVTSGITTSNSGYTYTGTVTPPGAFFRLVYP